jgi:hypothetical protein
MISEGIIHGMTSTLTRLNVAAWVSEAMKKMTREHAMVRKARLKTEYEWYNKNEGGLELIRGEEGLI